MTEEQHLDSIKFAMLDVERGLATIQLHVKQLEEEHLHEADEFVGVEDLQTSMHQSELNFHKVRKAYEGVIENADRE